MKSLTAVLLAVLAISAAQAAALTVTVDDIRSAKGDVRLSLYVSPAEWPDKSTKDHDFVMKAQPGRVVFHLDLPPGT